MCRMGSMTRESVGLSAEFVLRVHSKLSAPRQRPFGLPARTGRGNRAGTGVAHAKMLAVQGSELHDMTAGPFFSAPRCGWPFLSCLPAARSTPRGTSSCEQEVAITVSTSLTSTRHDGLRGLRGTIQSLSSRCMPQALRMDRVPPHTAGYEFRYPSLSFLVFPQLGRSPLAIRSFHPRCVEFYPLSLDVVQASPLSARCAARGMADLRPHRARHHHR